MLFWLGTKARRTTFGLGTAGDRLGTDRRRIRRRTATIGVFGFATVQSVRNALADIKRARLSDERLAVWTPSCGSRRERFASRGRENMCRLMCHCVRHISLDNKFGRSVKAIHSFLSHILPPAGSQNALDESHKKPSAQEAARRTGVLA